MQTGITRLQHIKLNNLYPFVVDKSIIKGEKLVKTKFITLLGIDFLK